MPGASRRPPSGLSGLRTGANAVPRTKVLSSTAGACLSREDRGRISAALPPSQGLDETGEIVLGDDSLAGVDSNHQPPA